MNDYREMIENLRSNTNNVFQQQAADAIEQLVRERDAAVKDLSHVLHNLGYDAILYSESVCGYCKHRHEKDGECQQHDCYSEAGKWEWRGVQNADS